MLNLTKSAYAYGNEESTVRAVPDVHPIEGAITTNNDAVTAEDWFALGVRVPYDRRAKEIVQPDDRSDGPDVVQVFRRVAYAEAVPENAIWTSFLPGWPDGSFGWAKVDQQLTGDTSTPRLYVEYVGHGDSDKPLDYPYGTIERADQVEALWKAEGITSTFIVGFDYSSIVALELLSRQQERLERGDDLLTRIEGVLLINGGLFVDAHTHPWYTTPILKSPIGGWVTSLAQRSKRAFGELMKPLWSKDYDVTAAELDELYDAIGRRNGVAALSKSAGFVDQHKRHSERWDLGRLFHALKDTVSFHIVGSEDDPFEWRQAITARERLGRDGLDVRILPGGHLTTSEHPELLASVIRKVWPQATGSWEE